MAGAMKDRKDLWSGEFGNKYHKRNGATNLGPRYHWLGNVLARLEYEPSSIVEFGCGKGANLAVLHQLRHKTSLYGVEANAEAAQAASPHCIVSGSDASATDFHNDEIDMAITCGLLIHIPPAGLSGVMQEIHRVTKRYILCAEYFAPSEEEVPYRGEAAALWRRDYGSLWLEQFPALKCPTYGFLWKPVDGLDNLTWWLFEKIGG